MDFNEYQKKSRKTAGYPDRDNTFIYPVLGLAGEAGEVADKVKKYIRDEGAMTPADLSAEQRNDLAKELGDVLWYIAQIATEIEVPLERVAEMNIDKTYSRHERGKIHGSGDDR